MSERLKIDGRHGEGGGQVLRTSLALSVATGRPFHIQHLRGGRRKPGLLRQHLTALRAAQEISDAVISGDELGSTDVEFTPGQVRAGDYHHAVGSAGSCMLVLQTILPPLLLADGASTLVLEGGTHNPMAPPFGALAHSFAPLVERLGGKLELELVRPGFYPAGGGEVRVRIAPIVDARPFELLERGPTGRHEVVIDIAHLDSGIAEKEWRVLQKRLRWSRDCLSVVQHKDSLGPGNAVSVHLAFRDVTEVLTAFGMKNVPSHRVARRVADPVRRYLASKAPVGEHLADQLMLPMALGAGGRYRTLRPSKHTLTNADVIGWFLGEGHVQFEEQGRDDWLVDVLGRTGPHRSGARTANV